MVASQIQGYGVWDGGVAQGGSLFAGCKGPAPSLLFLWVTDAQATSLQMELSAIQTSVTASGKTSTVVISSPASSLCRSRSTALPPLDDDPLFSYSFRRDHIKRNTLSFANCI